MTIPPMYVDYWYYFAPSYLLAVMMWACLGRFVLSLFFRPDHPNNIWRAFRRMTDLPIRLTAAITPRFMVPILMPLVAAFWLFVARIVFWIVMYANGLAPRLADYGVAG